MTTPQTYLRALATVLIVCSTQTWATTLPTNETYSAVSDIGSNFFGSAYTPLSDITSTSGVTASIASSGYTASARTTLGNNHAYTQGSSFPTGVFGAASFSGWYDQITITGGAGTGTAQFTVQLNGTVDVGAIAGGMSYTLSASSLHPSQLTSGFTPFQLNPPPWALDAATPIASYLVGVSPYNDASVLFPSPAPFPSDGITGIPSIEVELLEGDMGFPRLQPDLVLKPGSGQIIVATLQGSVEFTYDEPFYLIGGLGTLLTDGLDPFCAFAIGSTCTFSKDGTGATTLDFADSAHLINIALPQGATASFGSGTTYNISAVPEPATLALVGVGLLGWVARRST